ncbi:uncharacterized protein [Rutidosis leptorrhynchoides]|uniref:uncharacterized protein n=1 Tax=Rutidosis leptorrhynchoides TaxID=125765 RepID=UPI003A99C984
MTTLKCVDNISGLKINFHESQLYGLGVTMDEVTCMASRVNCKVDKFPFTYLGLPVGKNMNREQSWNPVIDKFNTKLANWKARTVSYGGRLTLVKSVLSSLALLFLAFSCPVECH